MPGSTSLIAPAISVEGLQLLCSNSGTSPDAFFPVCNISDFTLPMSSKTVDVTNVGDKWERMIPTLLSFGKISMKIFWVMEEPTHRNQAGGGVVAVGLRYLWINQLLRDWQAIYPDGNNSTDAWSAYVTGFSITGKVAGVFEATIEMTANDSNPSLV